MQLVQDTLALSAVESLRRLLGTARPVLVSAHALEQVGVNAIPEALADELGQLLDLPVDSSVVQTNVVSHAGPMVFPGWRVRPRLPGISCLEPTMCWSMISWDRAARWPTCAV